MAFHAFDTVTGKLAFAGDLDRVAARFNTTKKAVYTAAVNGEELIDRNIERPTFGNAYSVRIMQDAHIPPALY